MSKSLGNFLTVRDILARGPWAGEAFRVLLLRTHYRADLDFTFAGLDEAKAELDDHYAMLARAVPPPEMPDVQAEMANWVLEPLRDDLNTPLALGRLRDLRTLENVASVGGSAATVLHRIGKPWPVVAGLAAAAFRDAAAVLGVCQTEPQAWLQGGEDTGLGGPGDRRPAGGPQGARLRRSRPHPGRAEGQGDPAGGRAAGDDLAAGVSRKQDRGERALSPRAPLCFFSEFGRAGDERIA